MFFSSGCGATRTLVQHWFLKESTTFACEEKRTRTANLRAYAPQHSAAAKLALRSTKLSFFPKKLTF